MAYIQLRFTDNRHWQDTYRPNPEVMDGTMLLLFLDEKMWLTRLNKTSRVVCTLVISLFTPYQSIQALTGPIRTQPRCWSLIPTPPLHYTLLPGFWWLCLVTSRFCLALLSVLQFCCGMTCLYSTFSFKLCFSVDGLLPAWTSVWVLLQWKNDCINQP